MTNNASYRNNSMIKILLFLFPIILLMFAPSLVLFVSVVSLAMLGVYKIENKYFYVYFFAVMGFLSICITSSGVPMFLYKEHDFATYYNNYLDFLNYGFSVDFFNFAGGIEFGLPLLHYMLSIIIREPFPYFLLFIHTFLQVLLLAVVIKKVSKYHNLGISEIALFIAFTLIFFKYGTSLKYLRQSYSSLFILMALFSTRHKYLYIFIGFTFHVSAIIIYPILRFFLLEKNRNKLILFSILCLISALFIYTNIDNLVTLVLGDSSPLMLKLKFFIVHAINPEKARSYIVAAIIASTYLIFLIVLINAVKLIYRRRVKYIYNLTAMVVFMLSYAFLPGFPFRVLSGVFSFFMGYIFLRTLIIEMKIKQTYLILVIILIVFSYKWTLFSPSYYHRFPLASVEALYYVDTFFERVNYVDRWKLPESKKVKIINPYRGDIL